MMRTVQHPIAMFVIVVLVVIAIGAGVVAVTTNQKVYGPSWGRFTVAFPGRVYQYRGHTSVTGGSSGATSFQSTLEFPSTRMPCLVVTGRPQRAWRSDWSDHRSTTERGPAISQCLPRR